MFTAQSNLSLTSTSLTKIVRAEFGLRKRIQRNGQENHIKERWFQDKEDLDENFVKGRFDQMVVLRHCGGELPFGKHLKKIILDDPGRLPNKNGDFYSMAVDALRLAMQDAGISVPIKRRQCVAPCTCKDY